MIRAWYIILACYALACLGSLGVTGPIPPFVLWSVPAVVLAALAERRPETRLRLRSRAFIGVIALWGVLLAICASAPWWLPVEALLPLWLLSLGCVVAVTETMVGALRLAVSAEAGASVHG
jgi:hypothetical protein